jgi:hypothetical protein
MSMLYLGAMAPVRLPGWEDFILLRDQGETAQMFGTWNPMDDDLEKMDRAALVAEAKRLRAAIREHRDSSGHDLCWHHPKLWSLLPEGVAALPTIPAWPEFLRGCVKYRESLDRELPQAQRIRKDFQFDR